MTTSPDPANPAHNTRSVPVRGLTLAVTEAGPADGPLTVLLHGFPETRRSWKRQIGPLAEAGLRVVAPDQRGYGESSRPGDLAAYHLDRLAGDVIGLADAFGQERLRLVGHDWGGLVAWWAAARFPDRIDRVAILNAPHPDVFGAYARRHPSQALRSFYVAFFQLPGLPEALLRAGDCAALKRALTASSRPGTFGPDDLAAYAAAWRRPGAITAMLNWYRALRLPREPAPGPIRPPVLVLWGERDTALERGLAAESLRHCAQGAVRYVPKATHWLQHEKPEAVNDALIEFLTAEIRAAPSDQA